MPPATSVSSVKVTFSLTPASSSAIFFASARRMKWYTEFDDEFIRQIIQKITVEDADTIRIQFRDSNVVLEQGLQ